MDNIWIMIRHNNKNAMINGVGYEKYVDAKYDLDKILRVKENTERLSDYKVIDNENGYTYEIKPIAILHESSKNRLF